MERAELKKEIESSVQVLKTLRDEIRLDIHLASMDAKDAWKKLEPKMDELEHLARQVTDSSLKALADYVQSLRTFRDSLKRPSEHTPGPH